MMPDPSRRNPSEPHPHVLCPVRGAERGGSRLQAPGFKMAAIRRMLLPFLCLACALLLPGNGALAQSVSIDMGGAGTNSAATARLVQLTALVALLSLAPSLLVMVTAFGRIVIVLALLRNAIGAPGIPPNPVLIGLALFLTLFVMQPVLEQSWTQGLLPMIQGEAQDLAGLQAAAEPFRRFMLANVREADLELFMDLAQLQPESGVPAPWRALVPAFIVCELRRAFEIGFLIFLPFLVIDLVVASVLMGLGMMMLPPPVISLPFKLVFFVVVDGWQLISVTLVQGFATG